MRDVSEVTALLDELGIPVTQMQWFPHKAPPLPYCVLVPHETRNVMADGTVWAKSVVYDLELYAPERDVPLEQRLEAALEGAEIAWTRTHFADPEGPAVCAVYSMELTESEAMDG